MFMKRQVWETAKKSAHRIVGTEKKELTEKKKRKNKHRKNTEKREKRMEKK